MDTGKVIVTIGVLLVVVGLLWQLIGQFIGRLPGDIVIKKGNTTFFFPIVTSIIVSIVLSLLFMVFGRFFR